MKHILISILDVHPCPCGWCEWKETAKRYTKEEILSTTSIIESTKQGQYADIYRLNKKRKLFSLNVPLSFHNYRLKKRHPTNQHHSIVNIVWWKYNIVYIAYCIITKDCLQVETDRHREPYCPAYQPPGNWFTAELQSFRSN